jgi:HlyD family secretion protein
MVEMLTNRRVLLGLVTVGGLLVLAFWPETHQVEVATVTRGPLVVTVDEEGRTRVRDRFVISAPVTGRVLRIELEPGDAVTRGQVVARLQPETPPLLDVRTRAEAEAAVTAADAALGRARAEERRARAALAQAERELARSRELVAGGAMAAQEADAREAEARLAREAVDAAAYLVMAAGADLERAQARLAGPARAGAGAQVAVRSPVAGVVLRRLRESESVVPVGEPLIEVGDPAELEIVADLLSSDAVRVRPGARAMVEQWGGDTVLAATVRRIEPSGFTKVSALGVEEQRVNVVLQPTDPDGCAALGDAYRVDVRIVTWEADAVLRVPTGALFRENERWALYAVRDGRARLTPVETGHQTAREAEVLSGLDAGDEVIVHPGDLVRDGVRVQASSSS